MEFFEAYLRISDYISHGKKILVFSHNLQSKVILYICFLLVCMFFINILNVTVGSSSKKSCCSRGRRTRTTLYSESTVEAVNFVPTAVLHISFCRDFLAFRKKKPARFSSLTSLSKRLKITKTLIKFEEQIVSIMYMNFRAKNL